MSYTPTPYPNASAAAPSSADDAAFASPPPAHHIHKSSDVLPGARAQAQREGRGAQDVRDHDPASQSYESQAASGAWLAAPGESGAERPPAPELDPEGRNPWTEERPLDVRPTEHGGVAVGGRADVPETHASATDKLVGKTQKVVGKMTGKPEMHERGELRETGGKAAARGEGRAQHD
ncbi:hypothetical protein LXA43DRAFT_1058563 [Ganoderma leucocontextum]|nr:hypothetical protein LXA43DRAFT_1058563 [Ganoderma leucocontextum]